MANLPQRSLVTGQRSTQIGTHTTWILRSFSFLDDHIARVPSRQSCNVSTFSQSDSPGHPDVFAALCIHEL